MYMISPGLTIRGRSTLSPKQKILKKVFNPYPGCPYRFSFASKTIPVLALITFTAFDPKLEISPVSNFAHFF
jgi:hypothetical protein